MKIKNLALGVAALGLATLPVAGAFATKNVTSGNNSYVDTLEVTIASTCTFSRGTTAHEAGDKNTYSNAGLSENVTGNWGVGDNDDDDTLSGVMAGNAVDDDFGSSKFNVICNNANGWSITASATNLKNGVYEIPFVGVNNGGSLESGTAGWGFTTDIPDNSANRGSVSNKTTSNNATNIQNGANVTTGNAGVNFTVQYAVATSNELPTGTYKGSVTYTFAQI